MLQVFMLSSLLRGAGTGVVVVGLFMVGIVVLALTGDSIVAALMGLVMTVLTVGLVVLVLLHVSRFFGILGLSTALVIKRIMRRF